MDTAATLDVDLKANSNAGVRAVYSASKFVQLLGAHYWRRELPSCTIVAVSPGLIPDTKLASSMGLTMNMADAKTIPEGGFSVWVETSSVANSSQVPRIFSARSLLTSRRIPSRSF